MEVEQITQNMPTKTKDEMLSKRLQLMVWMRISKTR